MRNEFYPKVSIVIPVYNASNYMREAINSALSQTYKNIEVIVVNDGSNDNNETKKIALSYGNKIKYFEKENGGVATALNLAIEKMTGDYFSWLSHDDLYTKNKIKAQIEELKKLADKKTIIICGYTVVNERREYLWAIDPYKEYSQKKLDTPLLGLFRGLTNGCCMLIHKSHFKRVGLFDTKLRTANDYEMWFRMMRNQNIKYHKGFYVKSRYHAFQDSKKVTTHTKESDKLWINMMKSLTREEMIKMDNSVQSFYKNTYLFLLKNSNYHDVIIYAYRMMIEESKISKRKDKKRYINRENKIKNLDTTKDKIKKILDNVVNEKEKTIEEKDDKTGLKKMMYSIHYSIKQRGVIRTIGVIITRIKEKLIYKKNNKEKIENNIINFDYTMEPGKILNKNYILKNTIQPIISIITPFYNSEKYIEQTANCVLNQTFDKFEWIIIDDGSTDEKAKKKLKEIVKLDNRIKVLTKENEGASIARDYGVKYTNNTKYLFMLDADDLIENTYLECAYWTLEKNEGASFAYTDLVNFGEQQLIWNKEFDTKKEKQNNLLVNAALIRKEDFLEVNGFDIKEKNVFEDWNLWLKLLAKEKYPVRMNFLGFWYRVKRKRESEFASAKNNEKKAMKYIRKTRRKIKKNVQAIQYPNYSKEQENVNTSIKYDKIFIINPMDEINLEKILELKSIEILISMKPLSYIVRQKLSKQINIIYDLTTFIDYKYWEEFIKYVVERK